MWLHQEAERGARYILVMGTTNYRENARDHNEYLFDETFSSWQPFAAMQGYTQEELESNFAPYIELAAKRMHLSTADLLEQLKLRYGGFCIDEDLKYEMYNPRLINRFFAQVTSEEFNRDPQWQPQFLPLPEDEVPVRVALQSRLRAPQLTPSELDLLCKRQFEIDLMGACAYPIRKSGDKQAKTVSCTI